MPHIDIGKIKIYYNFTGTGPHLLLFPDNHLSSLAYQSEIEHFSSRFSVLAFDYPFTGRSSHEINYPDERQVDNWGFSADLACHLLLELKLERCFALGVSVSLPSAKTFREKA